MCACVVKEEGRVSEIGTCVVQSIMTVCVCVCIEGGNGREKATEVEAQTAARETYGTAKEGLTLRSAAQAVAALQATPKKVLKKQTNQSSSTASTQKGQNKARWQQELRVLRAVMCAVCCDQLFSSRLRYS